MKQVQDVLTVRTTGKGFFDITEDVSLWVRRTTVDTGILTLFSQHTSAGLTVQENADPDVIKDLTAFLDNLTVRVGHVYHHRSEGLDDMPAHIKTMLTGMQLSVPILNGRMTLGTWQGIYLAEHRIGTHKRCIVLHLIGSSGSEL